MTELYRCPMWKEGTLEERCGHSDASEENLRNHVFSVHPDLTAIGRRLIGLQNQIDKLAERNHL